MEAKNRWAPSQAAEALDRADDRTDHVVEAWAELLPEVRADARDNPAAYLRETVVPAGGE